MTMANVKLGEMIYEGVTAVKLNTEDGGTVTFKNAVLQEKTATANGDVVPDEGYDGLSKVTVDMPDVDPLVKELGELQLSRSKNCIGIFAGSNVTVAPFLDTSNVTDMSHMFRNCRALTEVPLYDTSNVTDMISMFNAAQKMKVAPLLDTSKVTKAEYMFNSDFALEVIPAYDFRSATLLGRFTVDCIKLQEIWIRNIKANITIGSGSSYGHLLTLESLIHLIYELRNTGSTKTLTIGSVNIEKLANVYVKTILITDDMRAEDELIDEKLPFEVCESTDENAVHITDYVLEKNWVIK
jgi:surface protein